MYTGKTLFSQIMDFLPWKAFHRLVARYKGDYRVRTLPCSEHFRVLAFAQLTYRESLRDIEACLSAQSAKLYHIGIRSPVKRSTLADANKRRDWRIYAEFAQRLIGQARKLCDRAQGIICDQTVALSDFYSHKNYPHHLRRIRFKDPDTQQMLIFLTNLFSPPPKTICELYKARCQVDTIFKWIKQHLRIKTFYGTSENAVKAQIWVAVSVCVLVAINKNRLDLNVSLYTLLQVFSVTLFEKIPLNKGLFETNYTSEDNANPNQLNLFDC